jgi:hypothetical protein
MKQHDELTMRYPTRAAELARYSLAMAWRDFRRKRIDGATFSASRKSVRVSDPTSR